MPIIGGKSFIDRSTGGTPIYQRSDTGSVNWTSGWVNTDGTTSLANGATLTFNHNLGTDDIIFSIYGQKDNGDVYDAYGEITSQSDYGAGIVDVTSNTITIRCAQNGVTFIDASGNYAGSVAQWGQTNARNIKVVATS